MKLGVIGLGGRLASMVEQFKKADPDLHLVGVVDRNEANARQRLPEAYFERTTFYATLPEMIQDAQPDALAIGTRCDTHTAFATEAAPYGLPLYLEKPVAISLEQARTLEQTFAEHPCEVVVGFPLRTSPLVQKARELLDRGVLGRLEHVLAVNYVPYGDVYFNSWYRDVSVTGGLFLQKATHDFDAMMALTGSPIVQVAATASWGRVHRDSSRAAEGPQDGSALYFENIGTPESGMNEDASNALLTFENGVQGIYTQVFYARRSAARRGMTLSGAKATVHFDWYDNELRLVHHYDPFVETIKPDDSLIHFGGDDVLSKNFVEVVKGKATSLAPLSAGLKSVYACLAARTSAFEGRFVQVEQVGERAA
jgi:predicted dehydrogenase